MKLKHLSSSYESARSTTEATHPFAATTTSSNLLPPQAQNVVPLLPPPLRALSPLNPSVLTMKNGPQRNAVTTPHGAMPSSPAEVILENNSSPSNIPLDSPLHSLPPHILGLLLKGNVSPTPCRLSPFKCVLTRHPIHRDSSESLLASLVSKIRNEGFDEEMSAKSPLVAVKYTKTTSVPTRAAGNIRVSVHDSWGEHPLVYVVGGAGRGEAVAQLVQHEPSHPNIKNQKKGLGFFLLNGNLSPWEIFLLSTALNAADPNSRPPSYFERTDQIAFICLEISRRKQADATCREVAVEVCFNPFLEELRKPLKLDPSVIPLLSIHDPSHSAATKQSLVKSRELFPWLPPGKGSLINQIPSTSLDVLDVLIDMSTCVNSDRMKYSPAPTDAKQKDQKKSSGRTEGFLHAIAEDQLRYIFREVVPLQSAAVFDVLVLRDLVGVVFGAIQECSRQFRQSVSQRKGTVQPRTDISETQENEATSGESPEHPSMSAATSRSAAAYWIERIVYEVSPGGLLAGMWNFPAAALVVLFYVYFVNQIRSFDKTSLQEHILRLGTTLYRCVAELALTLRVSKINLMTAPIPMQLRVLEGAALLFRFSLFGSVTAELFPPHPFVIPVESLKVKTDLNQKYTHPVKTFTDVDSLYNFLYSQWFDGIIITRLKPTAEYRTVQSRRLLVSSSPGPSTKTRWWESRRLDVTATANRLRHEVEQMVSNGVPVGGGDKLRLKRLAKRPASGEVGSVYSYHTLQASHPSELVDVEVIDPSILPMAATARLEFITLVHGVVSMLIERHKFVDSATKPSSSQGTQSPQVQVLTVPANMVVLAAIKVVLSFISPHFDKLAPSLTHWTTTRCRLVLWLWKVSREELIKRAEDRWIQLWEKQHPNGTPPPRLTVWFTTGQRTDKNPVELTAPKLAEVIATVLPDVLESMTNYYEDKADLPDEHVIREFFARWLKSAGDSDLITRVNTVLSQPLASNQSARSVGRKSPPSPQSYDHLIKRARHDTNQGSRDFLRIPAPTSTYGTAGAPNGFLPSGVASSRPVGEVAQARVYSRGPPVEADKGSKKTRKAVGKGATGDDDFSEWLEAMPFTDRIRLEGQDVPDWEVPRLTHVPAPDLLKWRPPDGSHSYSGNGLRGPPFDIREWQSLRQEERIRLGVGNDERPISRLSDLDWKVTSGVLKLLRARGMDVLVSRKRGQVFFLDHMLGYTDALRARFDAADSESEDATADKSEEELEDEVKRKKALSAKKASGDLSLYKKYGFQYFKSGEAIEETAEEKLRGGHIPNLESLRSFLEFDQDENI